MPVRVAAQTIDPDRGADGRDIVFCAERLQEIVIAATGDERLFIGPRLLMRLEDEAGVVIEIAGEARREEKAFHVEAVRSHETEPGIETIERMAEIEMRR